MHELNLAIFIWQAKLIVILQSLPPRPTCFPLLLLSNPDGSCVLVVLLLKVHRVHGYGKSETLAKYSTVYKHTFIIFTDFLRVAQEDQPGDNAARHSPWLHALVSVVRRQVHTRSAFLVHKHKPQSTNIHFCSFHSQVVTAPSSACSIPLCILLCTHTTCSRPWVLSTRSICGGRSTWQLCKWLDK